MKTGEFIEKQMKSINKERTREIGEELKNKGFGVRFYSNAVFVYLKNRNVSTLEVIQAIDDMNQVSIRKSQDPHRYNRQGVMVCVRN